jgi:hypothetical protein
VKQVPANLLDGSFTCGNAASIEVNEVVPAACELAARGNFDRRTTSQAIGIFIPAASRSVPQTKSLAGVGANGSPFLDARSPNQTTPTIGAVPDLTIDPIAFSTMFASPPFRLPGMVFALRSTPSPFQVAILPRQLVDQGLRNV